MSGEKIKMKKVMCFGTFDVLHPGHLDYFKQAKKFGDYLVVVVARDKNVKKERKVFSEKERLSLLNSLKIVNQAILGDLNDHFKVIQKIKPNTICLGYDHPKIEKNLKERFPRIKIKRLKPYKPRKYKSSLIKKTIMKKI